jgi:hypothetical protein
MALPQLTYPNQFSLPFEGAAADGSTDSFKPSASNVAAPSFFGRACLAVTTDGEQFVQPTGSAGVFLGILMASHAIAQSQVVAATGELPVNHPGAVLRKGRIWVVAEDVVSDITAGVFYRHTTPGADPEFLGRFRTDADTADATLVPEARWVRVTSAVGELTIVELNLP